MSAEKIEVEQEEGNTSNKIETVEDAPIAHHYSNEEKALLRKIDWTLIPWIGFLYFLAVEDRINVGYGIC